MAEPVSSHNFRQCLADVLVVQGLGHRFAGAPVLVEVDVQGAGYVEQTPDVRIAGFVAQTVHCSEQFPMALVFPVTACCDGFHDLCGGAPAFLGSLPDVAGCELYFCLA